MKLGWPVEFVATGAYLPEDRITNDDLAKVVDTSHEWIVQRTGIVERRKARDHECTSDLAVSAARAAMSEARLAAEDLDLIVCGTVTPDYHLPACACTIQHKLGCKWIPAFDICAACSGFVYGAIVAAQHLVCGMARTALVIGAEKLSTIVDPTERGTCILFGDAAGAAILRPSTDPHRGILAARWGADGARAELIYCPGGGSKLPFSQAVLDAKSQFMVMHGREVYKFAVNQMCDIIRQTCDDAGVSSSDVALLVPHQSNLRIIESACEKANIPLDRVVINIDRYGNTSAASVPVAYHESRAAGRVKPGDLVMLLAFGAGLTWASILMRV